MILIPDFYHYDKISSWADLKKAAPFVIFKATQGITLKSPTLDEYIKKCEQYEIPYWIYTYLNKGNELAQAKFLVKTCKKKVGSFFRGYVLDTEENNTAKNVRSALEWLNTQSPKTMLYTGYTDYNIYAEVIKDRGSSCAWWESRYGKNNGKYDPEKYPCHDGVDLYQFTSKGKIAGIANPCDLSVLTGAKPEIFFTGISASFMNAPAPTAEDIIKIAEGWLGLKESDGSYKIILTIYNDHKPLARGHKVTTSDSWCATFVSAVFIKTDAVDLIGGTECSVERMIEDCFKPAGIWNEDGRITPKPGYIIAYNWDDKTQPNDGWADHIGIVQKVQDGYIYVIEGNYSDSVKIRKIKVGDGRIRGYAIPHYAQQAETPVPSKKHKYSGKFPNLPKRGFWKLNDGIKTYTDKSDLTQIKRVQRLVNWINGGDIAVDGKYGVKTEAAVKSAQKKLKVVIDGEFGEKTLKAAKSYER